MKEIAPGQSCHPGTSQRFRQISRDLLLLNRSRQLLLNFDILQFSEGNHGNSMTSLRMYNFSLEKFGFEATSRKR